MPTVGLVQINQAFSGQGYFPYSVGLLEAHARVHRGHMSRSLMDLSQPFRDQVGEWLRLCASGGVAALIHCTQRNEIEQTALYQIGRRGITGERIVTNARAGESWHQYGAAIDAVPWEWYTEAGRPTIDKRLDWSPFGPDGALDHRWAIMVEAAETVGIDWSGKWTGFREYVHFQLAGVTIDKLREV